MPDNFAYLCTIVKIATIEELDEVIDLNVSIAYDRFWQISFQLSKISFKHRNIEVYLNRSFGKGKHQFSIWGNDLKFSFRGRENSSRNTIFILSNAVAIAKYLSVFEAAFIRGLRWFQNDIFSYVTNNNNGKSYVNTLWHRYLFNVPVYRSFDVNFYGWYCLPSCTIFEVLFLCNPRKIALFLY